MKRIVITGATSFIGAHLVKEYIEEKNEIYAIVRPNSENIDRLSRDERVKIIELDMKEYDEIAYKVGKADIFIHLAWEGTRVPFRDNSEIQHTNMLCALKAMEAARFLGCRVFLGVGSQAEYGKMSTYVSETSICHPVTEYGKKKLEACQELEKIAKKNGIRYIWTRIFSIYGEYDYNGTLIMSMLEKMKNNEAVELTACTQLWDFLNVNDAVRAITMLVENEKSYGIYNIASGNVRQLKEYVVEMKEVLKSNSELLFGAIPYSKEGPLNLMPDISKLTNTGWKPNILFKDGIRTI